VVPRLSLEQREEGVEQSRIPERGGGSQDDVAAADGSLAFQRRGIAEEGARHERGMDDSKSQSHGQLNP
jgi:hypothetical protein